MSVLKKHTAKTIDLCNNQVFQGFPKPREIFSRTAALRSRFYAGFVNGVVSDLIYGLGRFSSFAPTGTEYTTALCYL